MAMNIVKKILSINIIYYNKSAKKISYAPFQTAYLLYHGFCWCRDSRHVPRMPVYTWLRGKYLRKAGTHHLRVPKVKLQ